MSNIPTVAQQYTRKIDTYVFKNCLDNKIFQLKIWFIFLSQIKKFFIVNDYNILKIWIRIYFTQSRKTREQSRKAQRGPLDLSSSSQTSVQRESIPLKKRQISSRKSSSCFPFFELRIQIEMILRILRWRPKLNKVRRSGLNILRNTLSPQSQSPIHSHNQRRHLDNKLLIRLRALFLS